MRPPSRALPALLAALFLAAPAAAEPVADGLPLSAWVGLLKHPDAGTRRHAAEALGRLGGHAAAQGALVDAFLDDPDAAVSETAGAALDDRDEAVARRLTEALTGDRPSRRARAAGAVVPSKAFERAQLLALDDADLFVRVAAARGLAFRGNRDHRDRVVAALAGVVEKGTPEQRRGATDLLRDLGPDAAGAVPALRKALQDPELTAPAAEALGRIGPDARAAAPDLKALPALRPEGPRQPASAHQRDRDVRVAAAVALLGVESDQGAAYAALADSLDWQGSRPFLSPSDRLTSASVPAAERRHRIALSALAFGRPGPFLPAAPEKANLAALPHLLRALTAPGDHVRAGAAQALGLFPTLTDEAKAALRKAADEDLADDVRRLALAALAHAGEKLSADDFDLLAGALGRPGGLGQESKSRSWLFDWRETARPALTRPEALPALTKALASPDRFTREGAARALAGLAPQVGDALPRLKELAATERPWFDRKAPRPSWAGCWAAVALSKIDAERDAALPRLLDALADARQLEQNRGRGSKGEPSFDRDSSAAVRDAALRALARAGEKAVPHLLTALSGGNAAATEEALVSLLHRGADRPALPLAPVVAGLASPHDAVRSGVCRVLGEADSARGDAGAVAALRKALKDDVAAVRAAAGLALWRASGRSDRAAREVRPVLLAVLRGDDAPARAAAAQALAEVGLSDGEAPELLRLAEDRPEALVAFYAASGEPERALRVAFLGGDERRLRVVVPALLSFGPAGLQAGREGLSPVHRPAEVRRAAADLLAQFGPLAAPLAPDLKKALGDEDRAAAAKAAVALWRVARDAAGAPVLIEALAKGDAAARATAARVLGEMGAQAGVVPALTKALADPDAAVRGAAVAALGRLGGAALPALAALGERAQKDPDAAVRRAAVQALGTVARPDKERHVEAARLLLPCLDDKEPTVRRAAAQGLNRLDTGRINDLVLPKMAAMFAADPEDNDNVYPDNYLITSGPAGVRQLGDLAGHANPEVRLAALVALAEMGDEAQAALPALVKALGDDKKEVRRAAFRAVGSLEKLAAPAVPALAEKLKCEDKEDRVRAAQVLGALGEAALPALPALLEAARSKDDALRAAAVLTLPALRPDAKDALPVYADALARSADTGQAEGALRGLASLGAAGVPGLIRGLGAKDAGARAQAARYLAGIPDAKEAARPALVKALADQAPAVRVAAARALGALGVDEAAATALAGLLGDADADVRRAAATALCGAPAGSAAALLPTLRAVAKKDRVEAVRRAAHEAALRPEK
jgi:HEAT repeat protein